MSQGGCGRRPRLLIPHTTNPTTNQPPPPPPIQAHYEAMELFNSLAKSDELRMDHMLQPGEIQLLSNHTQLHTRAEFEDFDDVDQRRHLLRLWLAPAVDRPLPESYKEIYGGSVEVRV